MDLFNFISISIFKQFFSSIQNNFCIHIQIIYITLHSIRFLIFQYVISL
jgi:hypothetical protein